MRRRPGYAGAVTSHELRTLRALTARLVPGPPEDPDPGALEAGAAETIASLLDAFDHQEPPIHAALDGGFVPLDPVAELGWRIRLEGSQGRPEREFAGRVKGLAESVSDGLQRLDRDSREAYGVDFVDAPAAEQDALLGEANGDLGAFVALALTLTLEAVYGPPQYRANRDGTAWAALGWPGFTQPRGFTPAEVSELDAGASSSPEALTELRSSLREDAGWRFESG
jgi:Gluconate 2-dehydrogenase subunit 3